MTSSAGTAASWMRVWLNEARMRLLDRVDCDAEFQPAADAWLERVIARIKEDDAALHAVPADGMIPAVLPGATPSKTSPAASRLVTNLRLNKEVRRRTRAISRLATGD